MAYRAIDNEQRLTFAEFERLPEEDAYRVELVRGMLVRTPRPSSLHGRIAVRLGRLLDEHAEAGGYGVVLAEAGVLLSRDPDTVRGPDLAFYSNDRIPADSYAVSFWGAPDLAVEIMSPSNRASAMQQKVTDYLDAGVRRVWVLDPVTGTATVYAAGGSARILRRGEALDGDDVLPGLRLALDSLFSVA
jgi:Uma2 family endonuclease